MSMMPGSFERFPREAREKNYSFNLEVPEEPVQQEVYSLKQR